MSPAQLIANTLYLNKDCLPDSCAVCANQCGCRRLIRLPFLRSIRQTLSPLPHLAAPNFAVGKPKHRQYFRFNLFCSSIFSFFVSWWHEIGESRYSFTKMPSSARSTHGFVCLTPIAILLPLNGERLLSGTLYSAPDSSLNWHSNAGGHSAVAVSATRYMQCRCLSYHLTVRRKLSLFSLSVGQSLVSCAAFG